MSRSATLRSVSPPSLTEEFIKTESMSWLQIIGTDRLTAISLCLTVLGWALIWAQALALIEWMPPEIAIGIFALGLILIPFRPASRPKLG